MIDARTIRRAQAIYPFGPGAILDLGQESFVVLDTAMNSKAWEKSSSIRLLRLEESSRIRAPQGFKLPPLQNDFDFSLPLWVQRFPSWLFCPSCRLMWRWGRDQEVEMERKKQELPRCKSENCHASILIPMRYVAACSHGHLMEVDWWRWAHSKVPDDEVECRRGNSQLSFLSDGSSGTSLKSLRIRCNNCGTSRDLGDIQRTYFYDENKGIRCEGRQPWQAREKAEKCNAKVVVLLRSETSVHYADIVTALDLDEEGSGNVVHELDEWLVKNHKKFLNMNIEVGLLRSLFPSFAGQATKDLGREVTIAEIEGVFRKFLEPKASKTSTEGDPLRAELDKLSRPSPETNAKAPLRVRTSGWEKKHNESEPLFQLIENVMLVERLREVRAFRGFTRVDPPGSEESNKRLLSPDLKRMNEPQKQWKPAVEVFGEGLYIGFNQLKLSEWEESNKTLLKERLSKIQSKLNEPDNWISKRLNDFKSILPRFIMVHTFSHLFMRQLSYESGYNASSIRERLYVFNDKAGVLIYTADSDSEGSLGGLVRQGRVDRAENTIKSAIERATWCSNDPICKEIPNSGLEGLNQAACHACSLAPETSCMHLNVLLDRQLIIGQGKDRDEPLGYFAELI